MSTNYAHYAANPDGEAGRIDIFESKALVLPPPFATGKEMALVDYDPYLDGAAAIHVGPDSMIRLSFLHGAFSKEYPKEGEYRTRWQATIVGFGNELQVFETAFDSHCKQLSCAADVLALRPDLAKLTQGIDPIFAEQILTTFNHIANFRYVHLPFPHWEAPTIKDKSGTKKSAA